MAVTKEQRSILPPSPRELLGALPPLPTPRDLLPTPREAVPTGPELIEGAKSAALSAIPPPKQAARTALEIAGMDPKAQAQTVSDIMTPPAIVGGAIIVGAAILVGAFLAPK